MPFNALLTCAILSNVASFEILPTEYIYSKFLSFDSENSLAEQEGIRYELIGMETSNFMLNSGTLFLMLVAWFLYALIYFTIKLAMKVLKKNPGGKMEKFSNFLFFYLAIRILLESYLDLSLTLSLNIK